MSSVHVQQPVHQRRYARLPSLLRWIGSGGAERYLLAKMRGNSLKTKYLLAPLAVVQALLSLRVIWRMLCSNRGERIQIAVPTTKRTRVSVIVPILNERNRLSPCIEGLITQGTEVVEILVVDGGSTDGTQQLVCTFAQ